MTEFAQGLSARFLLLATAITTIALDLLAKFAANRWLEPGQKQWLIDGVLGLHLIENNGIAFGIGSGSGGWIVLLVPIALVALVWMLMSGVGGHSNGGQIAIGLIIGGAVANGLDRIPDGTVTDYFAVGSWPRFNIADSALTVGIGLMLFIELRTNRSDSR